jgi:hypothetical protein
MIKQTDPQTGPVIAKFGCYLFSILYKVEKRTGQNFLWPQIEAIYKSAMATGIVGAEAFNSDGSPADGCFVNDAAGLMRLAGAANAGVVSGPLDAGMFPVGLSIGSGDEVIQEWHNPDSGFTHFVCGAPDGSVEWDPIEYADGSGSITVRDGHQVAWRLLEFM